MEVDEDTDFDSVHAQDVQKRSFNGDNLRDQSLTFMETFYFVKGEPVWNVMSDFKDGFEYAREEQSGVICKRIKDWSLLSEGEADELSTELFKEGVVMKTNTHIFMGANSRIAPSELYFRPNTLDIPMNVFIPTTRIEDRHTSQGMLRFAEYMKYLHRLEILHGALNPYTVWLNSANEVSLSGFYIPSERVHTKSKQLYNAYCYIAPEVWLGKVPRNKSSDVYSFGVLLANFFNWPMDNAGADVYTHFVSKGLFDTHIFTEFASSSPLIDLIHRCIDLDDTKRPSFEEIVDILNLIIN
jgi:serine/threonine protein kinase